MFVPSASLNLPPHFGKTPSNMASGEVVTAGGWRRRQGVGGGLEGNVSLQRICYCSREERRAGSKIVDLAT
ncbi:hypothetical protein CDAR_476131 [Caerostris darwini]|uniref:Uncharacterized protein n=1 Tax=Caerostris darwini TaxID=1538125 RepID=A0AAV4W5W6_9ARAC|nr:hypothetical protein CDAR_476131 [Caerostris darwini]